MESVDRNTCIQIGSTCACANLRKASRVISQLYDEFLRPAGLRATQFGLLMAAKALGPITVTELASRTIMDRTTLTRNLKLLENRGLIKMEQASDQRKKEITLTDLGQESVARAMPSWEEAQAHVIRSYGKERIDHLLNNLGEIVSLFRKK